MMDYGIRIIGYGMRIMDYGLWIIEYGLWIMGRGLWNRGCEPHHPWSMIDERDGISGSGEPLIPTMCAWLQRETPNRQLCSKVIVFSCIWARNMDRSFLVGTQVLQMLQVLVCSCKSGLEGPDDSYVTVLSDKLSQQGLIWIIPRPPKMLKTEH